MKAMKWVSMVAIVTEDWHNYIIAGVSLTFCASIVMHAKYSCSEMKENNWVSMDVIITMVQNNHIHSKPAITICPFIAMH